ncbi:MAG: PHP domain-containing protein [Parachlamydiaceae bacterium]
MSLPAAFRADLHSHSTCSDGSLTFQELILLARACGLSALSITDHDSITAYPTALDFAKQNGLLMIPGVEFSAMHRGKSVHILAYSFDLHSPSIAQLCEKHTKRRKERNLQVLEKLAKRGMPIEESDLAYHHTIGRPHIAQAMINKGYVENVDEAFKKYLGDQKPCFAPGNPISVEETIDAIHQGKGLAVIAHPHLNKDSNLLHDILQLPFDGIECYYARFPEQEHERWLKLAKKKNLLVTGGSDFHGSVKPTIKLGSSWIDKTHFDLLYHHYLKHS